MVRSAFPLVLLCLGGVLPPSVHAQDAAAPAQSGQACTGLANEVTKSRELNRELNAYAGKTVPDEVQQRVTKHITQVAKLKAECSASRDQGAARK